jgi:hypothetical protein
MRITSVRLSIIHATSTETIEPTVKNIVRGIETTANRLELVLTTMAVATSPLKMLVQKGVAIADGELKARAVPTNVSEEKKGLERNARQGVKTNTMNKASNTTR